MRPVLETLEARLLLDSHPVLDLRGAEVEPNDTLDTATPLAEGYQLGRPCWFDSHTGDFDCPPTLYEGHGSLESADPNQPDVDFWSVWVTGGSVIRLLMEGHAATSGVLPSLLGSDGAVLRTGQPHDQNGDGLVDSAVIEYLAGVTDTFYIQVGPPSLPTTGLLDYALHAAVRHEPNIEHEPNDSRDQANPIVLQPPFPCWEVCIAQDGSAESPGDASGSGDQGAVSVWFPWFDGTRHGFIRGHLDAAAGGIDTDYFSFSADAERKIEITLHGDTLDDAERLPPDEAGVRPQLLDASGSVLATAEFVDRDGDGTPDAARLEYYTRASGQFFVRLAGHDSNGDAATGYELNVQVFPEPHVEHEPNNEFATANPIELQGHLWWLCDLVCPLAEVDDQSNRSARDPAVSAAIAFPILHDPPLRGFIEGNLCQEEQVTCGFLDQPVPGDQDFFFFVVPPGRDVHLSLEGPLSRHGGQITLFDADGNELASDADTADGITLDWATSEGGTLYVRVEAPQLQLPVWDGNCPDMVGIDCPGLDVAYPTRYRLNVTAEPIADPLEGTDEHEPNDTLEQANHLRLLPAHDTVPGLSLRERIAHGIAGGPTRDQDVFAFELLAGEHVSVGLGCVPGWPGIEPIEIIDPIEIVEPPPDSRPGFVVAVFDGAGNEIARTPLGGIEPVEFDVTTDGVFYAMVVLGSDVTGDEPLPYELHIHTQLEQETSERPDEHEPNDTLDQATPIELFPRDGCREVCILAGVAAGGIVPRIDDGGDPLIDLPPLPEPGGHRFGFVAGNLASAGGTDDTDYYSFSTDAAGTIRLLFHGPAVRDGVLPQLLDAGGSVLATAEGHDRDGDGMPDSASLEYVAADGGSFFVLLGPGSDSDGDGLTRYELIVVVALDPPPGQEPDSVEGPDEDEPNDTFDEANQFDLQYLPTFAPGIELRGGDAQGIVRAPTDTQDVFRFDVRAGEHVTVDVLGRLQPAAGGARSVGRHDRPIEFGFGPVELTVFDSGGNPVGSSGGHDEHSRGVVFDAASDGTYFAVVSASDESDTDQAVHYRLGVLAQTVEPPEYVPGDPGHFVIVLQSGESFEFTDSDGETVEVTFRGRGGQATIMFSGGSADGSDIASVNVEGARRSGNLVISSSGSAEVGSVEIHGTSRGRWGFGKVEIDGHLGSFTSDLSLRSLVVDGILGEVAASGHQIGQLHADVFDMALADVSSIRKLHIEEEMATALFRWFLPWQEEQE